MARCIRQIVVLLVLCGLLLPPVLAAQDKKAAEATLAIIAGMNFPKDQMTIKDLRTIYLGETQLLKDLWIHPIDQRENQAIRKTFLEHVVNMTRDRYIAYWNQRLFSHGGFSPLLKNNSREVIETVRDQDGAVGYVWLEEARNESGIKVLLTLEIP